MNITSQAVIALAVSTCGGTGSSQDNSEGSMSTCRSYQIMIDVELDLADNCQTDSECTEVIYGTGNGCSTDDRIATSSFDTSYLYDLIDDADLEGCNIDFGTTGECPVNGTPVCEMGACTWSN